MEKEHLIDEMEEVIYVSDPNTYEIYYMNQRGIQDIGLQDYSKGKCYELLQGKKKPCDFCNNALLSKDQFYLWEHTNESLNRHFFIKDKLIDWNGKLARMEVAIDITEKEVVSKKVKRKLWIEKTLVECIRSLTGQKELEEAVQFVLKEICQFYHADRSYIIEINTSSQDVQNVFEWCETGVLSQMAYLQKLKKKQIPNWIKNVQKDETLIIQNLDEMKEIVPEEYERLKKQGVSSILTESISMREDCIVFIGVHNPKENTDDISFIKSLSYFILNELSKRRLYDKLEYNSYHDSLTELNNRHRYVEYLKKLEYDLPSSLGIIYLDMNGLKQINDRYGHDYGDAALAAVAQVLKKFFPLQDIFRLGGDEFIVFSKNTLKQNFFDQVKAMKKEFSLDQSESVSIGYTWDDTDIQVYKMIYQAEEFLSVEKQKFYRKNPKSKKHHSIQLLNGLLAAIERKEFMMYLQPKINTSTKRIIGAEALVRYFHPQNGIIPPGKFIPLLEKEHKIRHIDLFMFEEVCKTIVKWKKQKLEPIQISLNFSRITLMEESLIETIHSICEKYDCPHRLIEIEITESAGEMGREDLISIAMKLKNAGFGLSLDDFGTKYTNINMLTELNVDVLKLDKSMINGIVKNEKSRIIVKNIIRICKDLKMASIAEGVETEEQYRILAQMDCNQIQGYLINKPLPLQEFEKLYCLK